MEDLRLNDGSTWELMADERRMQYTYGNQLHLACIKFDNTAAYKYIKSGSHHDSIQFAEMALLVKLIHPFP